MILSQGINNTRRHVWGLLWLMTTGSAMNDVVIAVSLGLTHQIRRLFVQRIQRETSIGIPLDGKYIPKICFYSSDCSTHIQRLHQSAAGSAASGGMRTVAMVALSGTSMVYVMELSEGKYKPWRVSSSICCGEEHIFGIFGVGSAKIRSRCCAFEWTYSHVSGAPTSGFGERARSDCHVPISGFW